MGTIFTQFCPCSLETKVGPPDHTAVFPTTCSHNNLKKSDMLIKAVLWPQKAPAVFMPDIRDTQLDPMSLFIWLSILHFLIQQELHPLLLGSLSPRIFVFYLVFFFFSVLSSLGLYRIVRAFSSFDAWALEHAGSVAAAQSCFIACGISVPWPGIEPMSPALEDRFLTTESPGKSSTHMCLYPSQSSLCPRPIFVK